VLSRIFNKFFSESLTITTPSYVNRHQDRNFLILGGGPSIKENIDKIKKLQEELNPVVIAVNRAHDEINIDYHAFTNRKRLKSNSKLIRKNAKLLLGVHLPKKIINKFKNYDLVMYQNTESDFSINNGIIGSNCRTSAVLMIAVAYIMGAKEIFIAGLDGYSNLIKSKKDIHFWEEERVENRAYNEYLLRIEALNDKYLNQINKFLMKKGHPKLKIITETTHLEYFYPAEKLLFKSRSD